MIRCGNRDHTDKAVRPAELCGVKHYHASVAQVRLCFSKPGQPLPSIQDEAYDRECAEDSAAEIAAEKANERFWEEGRNGGYYAGSREEMIDRYADSGMPIPPNFR